MPSQRVLQRYKNCVQQQPGINQLSTHVLQLVFLGNTGFRFPFAHFPCLQTSASELYLIFWKAVKMLGLFGFTVTFVSLDGARTNRDFMKMLKLGQKYIVWEHWYKAYQWDFYSNTLMACYQRSLRDKGEELQGSIELLQHTSVIIKNFRDARTITSYSAKRLDENCKVLEWFCILHTASLSMQSFWVVLLFLRKQMQRILKHTFTDPHPPPPLLHHPPPPQQDVRIISCTKL